MVWRRALAAVLLIGVLVAPAHGEIMLVEDEQGDQKYTMPNGSFRLPTAGEHRNVDIIEAGIWEENDDTLTFYVKPDSLAKQSERPVPYGDPVYDIRFSYGLQGYRVLITLFLENQGTTAMGENPKTFAELQIQTGTQRFDPLQSLDDIELDFGEGVVTAGVPRRAILDHHQAPLIRNATISNFSATATALGWFGIPLFTGTPANFEAGPPRAWDRAPDSYFDDASYKLVTGPQYSTGGLLAGSSDPVRWTNGEATTFVYTIRVTNVGTSDLGVVMSQKGIPAKWQVAFSDRYIVPAGKYINATVHVAIPFSHNHGALEEFEVNFQTPDAVHKATARLGVYWPIVPQPAGHHDMLWFHSRGQPAANPFEEATTNDYRGWINAADAQVDTLDEKLQLPANLITPPGDDGRSRASWRIMLEPALRMGLDFDLNRKGNGEIEFNFPLPVNEPVVTLEIRHYDKRFIIPRVTTLVSATSSQTGDLSGPVVFKFPELVGYAKSDLVRYVSVAELEFNITLTGRLVGLGLENPPEWTPSIKTATSFIRLPLNEYHDPLQDTFTTDASAVIEPARDADGKAILEKSVNPGKQVVYSMFLTYKGAFEQKFVVEVSGHENWASVLGSAEFSIKPGETREVAIAVAPPLTAPEGTVDTTVRAISVANAAVQGGMTVRTTVLRSVDLADEAELAKEKAQELAPPPPEEKFPWIWLILGILLAVVIAVGVVWKVRPDLLPWP